MTKTVYQTDDLGRFVAAMSADLDPLETAATGSNVYLIPRGAVETPPPTVTSGHVAVWSGDAWNILTEAEAANGGPLEIEAWRDVAELSRLEMGQNLRAMGVLTHAERMELMRGMIPAPLQAFIDLIPNEADREFAEAATAGGQPFQRRAPMWDAVAASEGGFTAAEIDALFGWTG